MAPPGKKLDLIPELTTHKSEYKRWPIPVHEAPSYPRCDDTRPKPRPRPPQIDWQSHLEYVVYVPFDLYIYKKPIIGEDPRAPFQPEPEAIRGGVPDHFNYTLPAKDLTEVTDEDLVRNLLICTYTIPRYAMFEDACLKPRKPRGAPVPPETPEKTPEAALPFEPIKPPEAAMPFEPARPCEPPVLAEPPKPSEPPESPEPPKPSEPSETPEPEPAKEPDCSASRGKVEFVPNLYPELPRGWLDAAKHWDCLQNRMLGDPTKTFWERRGPQVECFSRSDYKDLIPPEMRCEIRSLIDQDRLRLPFDVTKTGYGGFRPTVAKGVPLRRHKDFDF